MFKEYFNKKEKTMEVFDKNGWFITGDIATQMENGYIKIEGRQSVDIIKQSGYKISALDIERELLQHPSFIVFFNFLCLKKKNNTTYILHF